MRKKKVNYILEDVLVEDFAAEGNAIVRHEDKVVFVPYVVPGDIVDIEVYKQKH